MTQRNLFIGLHGDDVTQVQGALNFYASFMNPDISIGVRSGFEVT